MGSVVSSLLAGAAAGSMFGGSMADQYGRRTTIFYNCIPLIAGPLICASATTYVSLIIGRIICGVGIGVASALTPL